MSKLGAETNRNHHARGPRLHAWRLAFVTLLVAVTLGLALQKDGNKSPDGNFDEQAPGSFPQNWVSTSTRPILPATVSSPGAGGSRHSLLLKPSSPKLHQGASIWSPLPAGETPLQIEFSFAFGGKTRVMRMWTSDGTVYAATQLNLVIESRRVRQFHPLFHEWMDIGDELKESRDPGHPVWYRLRAITAPGSNSVQFWLSSPDAPQLPERPVAILPAYRTGCRLARLHVVVERSEESSFLRLDDVVFRSGEGVAAPPQAYPDDQFNCHRLWSGPPIPETQDELMPLDSVQHVLVHAPRDGQYTFLHGAAIVQHKGRLFSNWANSPTHENSPDETLQGSTSSDQGLTWSPRQIIARSPEGGPNYSHAAYLPLKGQLWTFAARFHGLQPGPGVRFPDLQVEAFVLNDRTNQWISRGIVARDMWPYIQPLRLGNGNWITAGQDSYGKPGVLISRGNDLTHWRTIKIPLAEDMPQGFGETALLPVAKGRQIAALVRPGRSRVAWISESSDFGETWTKTRRTNFPIGVSKMYAGRLSTGQPYVVANFPSLGSSDRDTLAVAVGRPGEDTLRKIYQVRYGPTRPMYPGFAKGAQWSYPYAHEYGAKLYIVYSINKEDCGLSIIPLRALSAD